MQPDAILSGEAEEPEQEVEGQLGIDLFLTRQVAAMQKPPVNIKTVERWIEKGLPAYRATRKQKLELFERGLISALPPHKLIYLIREADLEKIPGIRAYPKERKARSLKGTKTGASGAKR